jgi:hypothetical protein
LPPISRVTVRSYFAFCLPSRHRLALGKGTLFLIVAEWRGMDKIADVAQALTGEVQYIEAPAPYAGSPQFPGTLSVFVNQDP